MGRLVLCVISEANLLSYGFIITRRLDETATENRLNVGCAAFGGKWERDKTLRRGGLKHSSLIYELARKEMYPFLKHYREVSTGISTHVSRFLDDVSILH